MNLIQASRFKDAPWFIADVEVIVGGAGGIGSWLTLLLARAGYDLTVYDHDTFEEHNMSGQLVPKSAIGKTKVKSMQEVIKDFADVVIDSIPEKYDEKSLAHHYMFSGFDNMQARKDMFENWCKYVEEWRSHNAGIEANPDSEEKIDSNVPIFIDGRLTMEQMQIFCVTPDRIDAYKAHLFNDSEVPDAPCTLKQTSHSATMIASHMVGFFTNHITNNVEKSAVREVPFKWEYFIPLDYLQVKDS